MATPPTLPETVPPTPFPRQYLRPREITEMTGQSKSKVYKSLRDGDLCGHRIGGTWLIHVDDLQRWIEGGRHD